MGADSAPARDLAAEAAKGAERLLDYLAAEFDATGESLSAPNDVQFYYKMPAIFAYGGRRRLALATLARFEDKFLEGERFLLDEDPVARPWAAYLAGWLAWGAGALGRFDIAARVMTSVGDRQSADHGGYRHETDSGLVVDTERTSSAAMGCVWAGQLAAAERAAGFMAHALEAQPEEGTFYAYFDDSGEAIVERGDRNAYFAADDADARPALFATTISALVWAGRAAGNDRWFDVARGYMDLVLGHQHDAARLPLATKMGWVALMLDTHRPARDLVAFANRNAEAILERQLPDGSIGFDEVVDVPKPVAKVWLVGWGCDAALTLMAVANRGLAKEPGG